MEHTEEVQLVLSAEGGPANYSLKTAKIFIVDNNSKNIISSCAIHCMIYFVLTAAQIGFSNKEYVSDENDGIVNITISLLRGELAPDVEVTVNVTFYAQDETTTGM